jgi:pyrroline-5-carboxylate reductase
MRDSGMRIGFLGVGTVSTAVIHALSVRPGGRTTLFLSPRSADATEKLAATYPHCIRMQSNQAVIDASDMVVISMRPQQMDAALRGLVFRPDQIIASFVAAMPPSQMASLVAPATRIAQLVPLPPIALHKGPLLICPAIPEIIGAFAGLGDIVVLEDETKIRIVSCASAVMSTYYEMQNSIIDWAVERGLDRSISALYVRSLLEGLAVAARRADEADLDALPAEHETKGGLNERVRAGLMADDWFERLRRQLDDIYDNAILRTPAGGHDPRRRS